MGKSKGIFAFSGNFDVKNAAPLDTRITVETYDNLTSADTWKAPDNNIYLYKGLTVSLQDTGDVYVLIADDYTQTSSWKKVGNEPTVWDTQDLGWTE